MNITNLKALTISEDLTGIMSDITDDQFVDMLNQALILKQNELKKDVPDAFQGTSTVSSSDGYEIALPADIDPDKTKNFLLFWDTNRSRTSIISRSMYRRFGNKIRFDWQQTTAQQYGLEYQKVLNTYSSASMSTDVEETANPRASLYLRHEIRKLYFDALQQNEQSSAGINYAGQSNRIS